MPLYLAKSSQNDTIQQLRCDYFIITHVQYCASITCVLHGVPRVCHIGPFLFRGENKKGMFQGQKSERHKLKLRNHFRAVHHKVQTVNQMKKCSMVMSLFSFTGSPYIAVGVAGCNTHKYTGAPLRCFIFVVLLIERCLS